MDTIWVLIIATVIEGTCAVKIARKFSDFTPSWKFYVPVYNVLLYGGFSLIPSRHLFTLVSIQAIDLALCLMKVLHPSLSSIQAIISIMSFALWAPMVARIAVRLGQSFWSYLAATVFSAVASNFVAIALLYIFVPSFSSQSEAFPLWAEIIAIIIMSLPFISLAFDKKVQHLSNENSKI